jgi:hypothetical protein
MTFDTGLLIAKIVGSVFAGLYGLYATVTDFHKEGDPKTLSGKGKLGLALLLLATVINVGSDAIKQKRDLDASHVESARRDAETARIQVINGQVDREVATSAVTSSTLTSALAILDETSKTASQNIKETERLLDPIYDTMVGEAYFTIPIDQPLVRPYSKRVKDTNISLRVDQEGFPKENSVGERSLYHFLTLQTIQIVFTRNAGTAVLVFRMECKPSPEDPFNADLTLDAQSLHFLCRTLATKGADDGSFRSYVDLKNAVAHILVSGLFPTSSSEHAEPRVSFSLDRLIIHATNGKEGMLWTGRRLLLDRTHLVRFDGKVSLSAGISLLPSTNLEPK